MKNNSTFKKGSTEHKLAILAFLYEEQTNNVYFEFKSTVTNFLAKRNIATDKLFTKKGSLKTAGKIERISDGVISIATENGDISIPQEFLENVSLSGLEN